MRIDEFLNSVDNLVPIQTSSFTSGVTNGNGLELAQPPPVGEKISQLNKNKLQVRSGKGETGKINFGAKIQIALGKGSNGKAGKGSITLINIGAKI